MTKSRPPAWYGNSSAEIRFIDKQEFSGVRHPQSCVIPSQWCCFGGLDQNRLKLMTLPQRGSQGGISRRALNSNFLYYQLTKKTTAHTDCRFWRDEILSSHNRRAGVLEDQGEQQAQTDGGKACNHPQASAAVKFLREEQPNQRKDGNHKNQYRCNDGNDRQALAGEEHVKSKGDSITHHDFCHHALKFPVSVAPCHVNPLHFFPCAYLSTSCRKLQSFWGESLKFFRTLALV